MLRIFLFRRTYSLILLQIFLLLVNFSCAMQPGDRISTLTQTFHSDAKTQLVDMPLHLMPRFGKPDKVVFHAPLPKFEKSRPGDYTIDRNKDVKVTLTFLSNRFSVPQVTVFDARNRVTLRTLIVTFVHDEFEVVKIEYDSIYGDRMGMVDPSHPALRGFQLEYRWENVQEEDFGLGVVSMFISALLGFVVIFFMIVCSSEMSNSLDTPIVKSSSDATQRQKQTQHRY